MIKLILNTLIIGLIVSMPLEAKRVTCKSLSSCAEACKYLSQGHRALDRDKDGIPCEKLCSSPCKKKKHKKKG